MTFSRACIGLGLFLSLCLLTTVAPLARSSADSERRLPRKDHEIATGSFKCDLTRSIDFSVSGTSGLFSGDMGFGISAAPDVGVDCEALVADFAARAHSVGCATGPLAFADIGFICEGKRGDVVAAIAELGRLVLTSSE